MRGSECALASTVAAWQRLQQRAERGDRAKFVASLDKVPDVEAEAYGDSERSAASAGPLEGITDFKKLYFGELLRAYCGSSTDYFRFDWNCFWVNVWRRSRPDSDPQSTCLNDLNRVIEADHVIWRTSLYTETSRGAIRLTVSCRSHLYLPARPVISTSPSLN